VGPLYDAEAWFDEELRQAWRRPEKARGGAIGNVKICDLQRTARSG
jgi:hypothetical protein